MVAIPKFEVFITQLVKSSATSRKRYKENTNVFEALPQGDNIIVTEKTSLQESEWPTSHNLGLETNFKTCITLLECRLGGNPRGVC